MDTLFPILKAIALILAVVLMFNLIIFVHELGHFLAGKWRGLKIDRFQIWFGRPIWKKEINGVQYGLGWIPAGGFVSLPQMAPMGSIEGASKYDDPIPTLDGDPTAKQPREQALPPITPLDKIIVAFAGPLFSLGLALLSAVVVWGIGKPQDFVPTQTVGFVAPGSPAEKAGMLAGDKIIQINGARVNGFQGSLDSIMEGIVLSKGKQIHFTVERPGSPEPLKLISEFKTEESKWFQRAGLRQVGIRPATDHIAMGSILKGSPADKAGFKEGDRLVSMNGQEFTKSEAVIAFIKETGAKPIEFEVLRKDKPIKITATPQVPISPEGKGPMLGLAFYEVAFVNFGIVHPGPIEQMTDTVRMMWTTINRVIAPDSSIGVGHLSGPVGIATMQYELLQTDQGWRRILGFMVLFNVNLAILNMMPFPVLDGGHIVLAIIEKIAGRPVRAKPLEIVQTCCALALMSLMLFVTSKDIGDRFGRGGTADKIVFPAN